MGGVGSRRCVLLWIIGAHRATWNHTANVAVDLANKLNLPVVACVCLVPSYPFATLRAYRFAAEGLRELPDAFAERGIGWVLRVGKPERVIPTLASQLGAAAIVADFDPRRVWRSWTKCVGERAKVPMITVDTNTVVPSARFEKEEWSAATMRANLVPFLPEVLAPIPSPSANVASVVHDAPDPVRLLDTLPVDRTVGPSHRFKGGTSEGRKALDRFVRWRLSAYGDARRRVDVSGTSELSPYLHFGQISPTEVVLAVASAMETDGEDESAESYLDELVVRRELAINFALRNANYDRYEGLPDWGRKTLAAHAADPRPVIYDRETLEHGDTEDRLWNAAQCQLLVEGWMPGVLRQYWAKQLLYWTKSPQEAFEIACEFNDRYFVDGRDPSGYAGIAWAIGGRHDRPFPPEQPIIGLIRSVDATSLRQRFDADAYINQIERRYGR